MRGAQKGTAARRVFARAACLNNQRSNYPVAYMAAEVGYGYSRHTARAHTSVLALTRASVCVRARALTALNWVQSC